MSGGQVQGVGETSGAGPTDVGVPVAPSRSALRLRALGRKVGGAVLIMIGAVLITLCVPLPLVALATGLMGAIVLSLLVPIVLLPLGFFLIHRGKSTMTLKAEEAIAWDSRPPVLYLRSFADDGIDVAPAYDAGYAMKYSATMTGGLGAVRKMESFEELVVRLFKKLGPVLAVSRPDQKGLPPGAARLVIVGEDNDWKDRVRDMIGRSRAVVLIAGKSPGLNWELGEVVAQAALEKLWILFPPEDKGGARADGAQPDPTRQGPTTRLQFVRATLAGSGVGCPDRLDEAGLMLLRFGRDNECREVEAPRNREGYERCLGQEIKAVPRS